MPLYRVHVDKRLNNEVWTNRYFVQQPTLADAHQNGRTIMEIERDIHGTEVEFVRVRTDDNDKNTEGQYIVDELSLFGEFNFGANDYLPLFNVVVVEFSTGLGRPSRKYLRLPLHETGVNAGKLNGDWRNIIHNTYVVPLSLMATHRDVDNQMFVTGAVRPDIGMRQLKRKRKPKVVTL